MHTQAARGCPSLHRCIASSLRHSRMSMARLAMRPSGVAADASRLLASRDTWLMTSGSYLSASSISRRSLSRSADDMPVNVTTTLPAPRSAPVPPDPPLTGRSLAHDDVLHLLQVALHGRLGARDGVFEGPLGHQVPL